MSNTYIKRPLLRPFLGQRPNAKRNLHLRIIAGLSAMTIAGFGAAPVHAATTFTNQVVTTPVVFDNNGGNFAQGSTFDSTIDLTESGAYAKLIGANTFNGTTTMATSDGLHLQDGNALLTIGASGIIQGYGRLIQDNSGATINNSGTIDANNSSGTLLLGVTNLSNSGTLEATNGGTLQISSTNVTNSGAITANGGNVDLLNSGTYSGVAGSSLNQEVGQLLDDGTALTGDVTITGTTGLSFSSSGNNILNAATVTGNIDLATVANSYVRVVGNNTFNDGTITLDSASSGAGLNIQDGNSLLTVGANGTIQGTGYIIQDNNNADLVNNGLIDANVAGQTLNIQLTNFTNNATVEATNGGTLSIASANINNNGAITAGTGSEVDLNGGTFNLLANSTLNQQGTGVILDNGATLTGNVDITGATGLTFDTSGSNIINAGTIQGNINLDNASHTSYVRLQGANTYDKGTISLGSPSAGNGIHLQDGNASLTLGSAATINGYGYITRDNSNATVTNNGVINATSDGLNPGETLTIGLTNVNNNKTLEATAGGTLNIASTKVVNTGTIEANGGDVYLQSTNLISEAGSSFDQVSGNIIENGTLLGDGTAADGILNILGTTGLEFTTSGNNIINTGTVTGNLDLNDSTHDSYVRFQGVNTYDDGTISLDSASAGNGIHLQDGNTTLTLGANSHINGYGYIAEDNSNSHLNNNGTIDAISDGLNPSETMTIGVTNLTNNATLESTSGGQLDIESTRVYNNGAITANGGNVLLQSGDYIGTAGSSLNQTAGQFVENATLFGDGTAADGIINITGSQGLLFTTSGSNIINTGTVTGNLDLNDSTHDSYVRFQGVNTYDDGTITLDAPSAGNGIHLQDGNTTLTLGANSHINGYGYIAEDNSNSHLNNNGTINAENDGLNVGETLNVQVTNLDNTGTIEATNKGILSFLSTFDTNSGSIVAENGATTEFNGGTYIGQAGGTIGQVGTGQLLTNNTTYTGDVAIQGTTGLTFNTSGGNVITNANVTGNLDLATNSNAFVRFSATDTFDSGTINIAVPSSSNGIHLQDGNTTLTIGSQGTVQGYGYIVEDNSNSNLINNGTIDADSPGNTLAVQVSHFDNTGTTEATNGGLISLQSAFDTNSGSIVAENGSTVGFNGGTYIGDTGGTIGQVGTGQLIENGTTFTGNDTIQGATGLTLNSNGGNIFNTANVTGNLDLATNDSAYVKFVSADTFDAGTINLAATTSGSGVHLQDGNTTLTIGTQGTVQGYGAVTQDNSNANLINNGTIVANTAGQTLGINVTNFTNFGTVAAAAGATLTSNNFNQGVPAPSSQLTSNSMVAGPPEQTQVDGTLTIGGGSGTETVYSGLVEGTGAINGSIDNVGGTVKGGDSPGTLTINGNYNQGAGGSFLEQLGGTPGSGLFDVVDVTGTADLAGTLDVSLLNGFAPVVGDEFTFLNATGGVNGTFDPTIVGPAGYTFDVLYGTNDAVLQIESAPANAPAPESSTAVSFGMMLMAGLGFLGFKSFRRRQED